MPELDQLVSELRAVVQRYSPDWTDSGAGDPGITLLELFAFLAEELVRRADQIPERSRPYLAALMSRLTGLEALMGPRAPEACPGPKWVRYFSGQLLSADDFSAEQEYFRLLLGYGVVSGLEATVMTVKPCPASSSWISCHTGRSSPPSARAWDGCSPATHRIPAPLSRLGFSSHGIPVNIRGTSYD